MKVLIPLLVVFVVCIAVYFLLPEDIACRISDKLCQQTPTDRVIIEQPNDTPRPNTSASYDLVISQSAVGGRAGHSLAITSIIEHINDGKYWYEVEIDIDQDRFVVVTKDDIIKLDEDNRLQVAEIIPGESPEKFSEYSLGKVMFNAIEPQ